MTNSPVVSGLGKLIRTRRLKCRSFRCHVVFILYCLHQHTWLINFEYVRKSPQGELATRFLHAAAFFAPNEIQEKLINCELFSSDHLSHQNYNFALLRNEIVEILTKFSLFQRKSCSSLGLHRLVQEVIRNRMTIEETASSLLKAVQLLHQSFRGSPSPDQILVDITASDQKQPSRAKKCCLLFSKNNSGMNFTVNFPGLFCGFCFRASTDLKTRALFILCTCYRIFHEFVYQSPQSSGIHR